MSAAAVVSLAALAASLLTFFSGFGLGTLLLPAFALFFAPQAAVALTGLVHLANSLFKLALLARRADWGVVLRFGAPAILAAAAGATALMRLGALPPLAEYGWLGHRFQVQPVKLALAALMLAFALLEALPALSEPSFERRWLPLGGLLSGFFGGLSGHQGALRAAFLTRSGLGKEEFVGTGAVISAMVDLTRLTVYASRLEAARLGENGALLALAAASALAGSLLGSRLLGKVTLGGVRRCVSAMLGLIALLLAAGLL